MLFRYRARNFPDSLNLEETSRWHQFCHERLHRPADVRSAGVPLITYYEEIARLHAENPNPEKLKLLKLLAEYGREI